MASCCRYHSLGSAMRCGWGELRFTGHPWPSDPPNHATLLADNHRLPTHPQRSTSTAPRPSTTSPHRARPRAPTAATRAARARPRRRPPHRGGAHRRSRTGTTPAAARGRGGHSSRGAPPDRPRDVAAGCERLSRLPQRAVDRAAQADAVPALDRDPRPPGEDRARVVGRRAHSAWAGSGSRGSTGSGSGASAGTGSTSGSTAMRRCGSPISTYLPFLTTVAKIA